MEDRPLLQLSHPSVQIGLDGGGEKQSGAVGTEVVQIKVHRPFNEGGDAPAPVLLIPALQDGLFLRREVEWEFLFFAHIGSFPGVDLCFFLVAVGFRGL